MKLRYIKILFIATSLKNENIADNYHNLGKLGRVKSPFTWQSMEGDRNVYTLCCEFVNYKNGQ